MEVRGSQRLFKMMHPFNSPFAQSISPIVHCKLPVERRLQPQPDVGCCGRGVTFFDEDDLAHVSRMVEDAIADLPRRLN